MRAAPINTLWNETGHAFRVEVIMRAVLLLSRYELMQFGEQTIEQIGATEARRSWHDLGDPLQRVIQQELFFMNSIEQGRRARGRR